MLDVGGSSARAGPPTGRSADTNANRMGFISPHLQLLAYFQTTLFL